MRRLKYRAVYKTSGWIFCTWGVIVVLKGIYDVFIGLPESEFVPLEKFAKYSGFEVVYGIACVLVGLAIFEFAKHLPEFLNPNNSTE